MRSIYLDPVEPAPESAPLLLSAPQAAKSLGICQKSLWSLTKRGEIKACRIGARCLYSRTALEEFICRQEAAQQPAGKAKGIAE